MPGPRRVYRTQFEKSFRFDSAKLAGALAAVAGWSSHLTT
jgi:hypothetical protein